MVTQVSGVRSGGGVSTSQCCAAAGLGGAQITGVLKCGGGGCIGLRIVLLRLLCCAVGAVLLAGC
eukprot:2230507-Pyramimonas_sp.AAC.1